jgi:hypothetical protein
MAIDVLENVLDQDLAAQLFTEERDVGPDNGAKIEEQGLWSRAEGQAGEKLGERLRWMDRRVAPAISGVRFVFATTGEEVGE